MKDRPVAEPSS